MNHLLALTAASMLLLAAAQANAAAVLSPSNVVVPLGGPTVHLTPRDQDGNAIDITKCTVVGVPGSLANVTYDATGAVLAAVGTGSTGVAFWKCVNQATTVQSAYFKVTVPWSVTEVGHTSP